MPNSSRKKTVKAPAANPDRERKRPVSEDVKAALAGLKAHASKSVRDGMARYAIPSEKAFGVSMKNIQLLAKQLGRSHELALALWDTGWYEARMMAAFIDEPERVTAAQMDRWCREFDNWAICDTICFALFDRTAHAWAKVEKWSRQRDEFVRRAAFALLWALNAHDDNATDDQFAHGLQLIEEAATDERNFVKKAVNMALRSIGRRSRALHAAAVTLAQRLANSPEAAARWVGKDALRELTSPAAVRRLAQKDRARA
jgi:3-methyladenine DNA glycosylase AlkD